MNERDVREDAADVDDIFDELQAEVAEELAEEQAARGGPAYQVAGALVALVLGLSGAVLSWGYGLNTLADPGPGLWPFVLSVLISGLALLLLATGTHLQDAEAFTRSSLQPMIGLLTFVGLAILMPRMGFEVPALLMCLVWTRFLGDETWRSSVLVSILTVAAFHLVFIEALGVPLPRLI